MADPLITSLADHFWVSPGGTLMVSAKFDQIDPLDSGDGPLWPRFVLIEPIGGLRSLPELDDNREQNSEFNGERPLTSYARGKTLGYSGRIYGRPSNPDGWVDCHAGADAMLAALGPDIDTGELQTGFMRIAPTISGHEEQTLFGAICRSCVITERIVVDSAAEAPSPYFFPFTFELRMNDGRFVEWDPEGGSGEDGAVVADSFKW